MRWNLPAAAENIKLERIFKEVQISFGEETIRRVPSIEKVSVYNAEGAGGTGPAALRRNLEALLPEVKKSLDGCRKYLGTEGVARIHMDFDMFLPPGVGGTGGGGRINLDLPALFPFVHGTDSFPQAYWHELGHNVGFGHDPYMLLVRHLLTL